MAFEMNSGFSLAQWLGAIPLLLSIVGIVCSASGSKASITKGGKGMATTGIVFSIIALCFGVLQLLSCGVCLGSTLNTFQSVLF